MCEGAKNKNVLPLSANPRSYVVDLSMSLHTDKCCWPGCRRQPEITYTVGPVRLPVCDLHWQYHTMNIINLREIASKMLDKTEK
jgi:hypothetical protein